MDVWNCREQLSGKGERAQICQQVFHLYYLEVILPLNKYLFWWQVCVPVWFMVWTLLIKMATHLGFLGGSVVKNLPANTGFRRCGFNPRVGKILWRRKWQATPVFLPGKFHEQRSLVDYGSWGGQRVRLDWVTELKKRKSLLKESVVEATTFLFASFYVLRLL